MKSRKRKSRTSVTVPPAQKDGAMTDPPQRLRVYNRMRELMLAGTAASIGLSATLCGVACDPAPPPVWNCSDSTSTLWKEGLHGEAGWHQAGAEWTVVVNLTLDNWLMRTTSVKFSGNPQLTGATLKVATVDTVTAAFTCVPDSGSQRITAIMPMKCESLGLPLKFNLDISGSRNEGAQVPILPVP